MTQKSLNNTKFDPCAMFGYIYQGERRNILGALLDEEDIVAYQNQAARFRRTTTHSSVIFGRRNSTRQVSSFWWPRTTPLITNVCWSIGMVKAISTAPLSSTTLVPAWIYVNPQHLFTTTIQMLNSLSTWTTNASISIARITLKQTWKCLTYSSPKNWNCCPQCFKRCSISVMNAHVCLPGEHADPPPPPS